MYQEGGGGESLHSPRLPPLRRRSFDYSFSPGGRASRPSARARFTAAFHGQPVQLSIRDHLVENISILFTFHDSIDNSNNSDGCELPPSLRVFEKRPRFQRTAPSRVPVVQDRSFILRNYQIYVFDYQAKEKEEQETTTRPSFVVVVVVVRSLHDKRRNCLVENFVEGISFRAEAGNDVVSQGAGGENARVDNVKMARDFSFLVVTLNISPANGEDTTSIVPSRETVSCRTRN